MISKTNKRLISEKADKTKECRCPCAPISEREMRATTASVLHDCEYRQNLRVFEELSIEQGRARVDFATVNGLTHAYELKSDFDSLTQLSNQIHAYGRVFDRVTIVTGRRWLSEIQRLVPAWWGIIAAHRRECDHEVVLQQTRRAKSNPAQDPYSVASMLWREEAIELIEEVGGIPPKAKASRAIMYGQIADDVPLSCIKKFVAKSLYKRKASKAVK